jgi:phosphoribosylformimino-5-aminoimidazole carboxamide ribotide isomerase
MGQPSRPRFDVYPAIDVLEGRCVRLDQGRRQRVTVEGGDPAAAAAAFVSQGARKLHLVDLDGAFSGSADRSLLRNVVGAAGGVPVQVGGGLRSVSAIEAALDDGASRVVVGTATTTPGTLERFAARFGPALAVAIDVRDGCIVTDGWTRTSVVGAPELAARSAAAGVPRLLVTSTRRDGSLRGPDLRLLEDVRDAADLPVIAAGGIASLSDLGALRDLGCEGAVVGSALWLGRFSLAEALRAVNGSAG